MCLPLPDQRNSYGKKNKIMSQESEKKQELYVQTALKAGQIALSNGAETARCDEIMRFILLHHGEEEIETSVVSTSIFVRLGKKMGMATIKKWGVDMHRICRTNDISRQLYAGTISIEEASAELKKVENEKLYGLLLHLVGFAVIMGFLPVLLSGSILDCVSGAFCGIVIGCLSAAFERIRIHSFAAVLLQTFCMVLCSCLAFLVFRHGINFNVIMVAAITPMLPGLAVTNAVRDSFQGDYVSGAGRLMEAIVRATALSLGVCAGLYFASLFPVFRTAMNASAPAISLSEGVLLFVYIASALFSCAGYGFTLSIPARLLIISAVIGAIGKIGMLVLVTISVGPAIASFLAMLVVAILAQLSAMLFKAPAIPFMISGIMVLAPGTSLYSSVLSIVLGSYREGARSLLDTMYVAVAIAVAIFIVGTIFQTIRRARKGKLFLE